MPPTQYPLSGKAAPPPNSRDAFPSFQQGADPLGWAQGDPREPQGAQGYLRAPSAPLGEMGPRGPLGLYEAIPNGTPFRLDGYYETTPKLKPWLESRLKGKASKWYQMVHGQHWARNNQTTCTKTFGSLHGRGFEMIKDHIEPEHSVFSLNDTPL